MATIVSFHAHPDDESIATGGVLRKAADEGHRTVLVSATHGERGEIPEGFLAEGEQLASRRIAETRAAAEVLGVSRVEFLGYEDSGMVMGEAMQDESNFAPNAFWTASVEEAAERLATILREEQADVLTCYDEHGGYGHPDHIQVHRVGMLAAKLAGTPRVYQATQNRDQVLKAMREYAERSGAENFEPPAEIGMPEAELTTEVDVREYAGAKRAAMRAHASQIAEDSFFLAMPEEDFLRAFGTEWFIRVGTPAGISESDLLTGL
ncbi:PIG-L family deacetylase [Sciscionella sediminilitoris]|uniref:PIG-L family deacetylase n=1 Tax=Sciscionella sediminilitoris TaxID=1445613 RepID=UPI0004DF3898|nr:PIG-L family deacetylase [Sciscionella sp. SE31]